MKKIVLLVLVIVAVMSAQANDIVMQGVDYYYGRNGKTCDKVEAFRLFNQATESNVPLAFVWVGFCYTHGEGVEKDIDKGVEFYKKSADMGFANGQYLYASWLLHNKSERIYKEEAVKYLQLAAAQDHINALNKLANCFRRGIGTKRSYEKAYEYYKKSADLGDAKAQYEVGEAHFMRDGADWDADIQFKYYSMSAKQKYPLGLYRVGNAYFGGFGVKQDFKTGVEYFREAAELKNPEACGALGHAYLRGIGVKQDDVQAIFWFQKGAALNDDLSLWYLGMCYEGGKIIQKNPTKAFECYQKSVARNSWFARYALGRCYEYGIGVEKDLSLAFENYKKSYHNTGIFKTANFLFRGIGVEKNEAEGFKQLQRLVSNKSTLGYYLTAECYENGTGVEKNLEQAFTHYEIAANNGVPQAMKKLVQFYTIGLGTQIDLEKATYWQKIADSCPPSKIEDFLGSHADNAPK